MKWIKTLGLGIVGFLLVLLVIAAIVPANYRVERKAVIHAPTDTVFSQVVDLKRWQQWNPWQAMDPEASNTYTGTMGQTGSSWIWDGEVIGKGKITIRQIDTNRAIQTKLQFFDPEMTTYGEWIFEPVNDSTTRVTWANEGTLDYPIGRFMGLFLDDMLGPDFEEGLKNLKEITE